MEFQKKYRYYRERNSRKVKVLSCTVLLLGTFSSMSMSSVRHFPCPSPC
jgi:hypothetical protein